jgi:hypothetical protein
MCKEFAVEQRLVYLEPSGEMQGPDVWAANP